MWPRAMATRRRPITSSLIPSLHSSARCFLTDTPVPHRLACRARGDDGVGAERLLRKQRSCSPDTRRDAAWARRRAAGAEARTGRSVTEDDLHELRGCVDLGFKFDTGCGAWRSRLAETFPRGGGRLASPGRYSLQSKLL
uniref:Uncharacterized protein n=1 Tax=Arundo donax TaxID=35708 RepID=A0A0A9C9H1_ARUDO